MICAAVPFTISGASKRPPIVALAFTVGKASEVVKTMGDAESVGKNVLVLVPSVEKARIGFGWGFETDWQKWLASGRERPGWMRPASVLRARKRRLSKLCKTLLKISLDSGILYLIARYCRSQGFLDAGPVLVDSDQTTPLELRLVRRRKIFFALK